MKKIFKDLISDSNRVSSKRIIGLICLVMFVAYGVMGLVKNVDINFWIFYVSLCAITLWIAFRFMSSDKALKYNILGELSKFGRIGRDWMNSTIGTVINNEQNIDNAIQPPIEQIPPDPEEK